MQPIGSVYSYANSVIEDYKEYVWVGTQVNTLQVKLYIEYTRYIVNICMAIYTHICYVYLSPLLASKPGGKVVSLTYQFEVLSVKNPNNFR